MNKAQNVPTEKKNLSRGLEILAYFETLSNYNVLYICSKIQIPKIRTFGDETNRVTLLNNFQAQYLLTSFQRGRLCLLKIFKNGSQLCLSVFKK